MSITRISSAKESSRLRKFSESAAVLYLSSCRVFSRPRIIRATLFPKRDSISCEDHILDTMPAFSMMAVTPSFRKLVSSTATNAVCMAAIMGLRPKTSRMSHPCSMAWSITSFISFSTGRTPRWLRNRWRNLTISSFSVRENVSLFM